MKRVGLSVVALLLPLADQADAAHCAHGLFWRVSLNQCVGVRTKLALAYERRPASRKRIALAMPFPAPKSAIAEPPRPEIEILRERLAQPHHLEPVDILLSRAAALTSEESL